MSDRPSNPAIRRNGRPAYEELARPLASRFIDISPWREYTTLSRTKILRGIEDRLRSQRFAGELCVICETGFLPYQVSQEVDLSLLKNSCPEWSVVSYDQNYDKSRARYGLMEMAIL